MTVVALHRTRGFLQENGKYAYAKDDLKEFPDDLKGSVSEKDTLLWYVDLHAFDVRSVADFRSLLVDMICSEDHVMEVTRMLQIAVNDFMEHDYGENWRNGDALFRRCDLPRLLHDNLPSNPRMLVRAYKEITGLEAWYSDKKKCIVLENRTGKCA